MNTFRMAPVKDEDDDRGRGDGFTLCFTISLTFGLPLNIVRSAQNIAKVKCQVCVHIIGEAIRYHYFSFFFPNIVNNLDYSQMTTPL